MTSIRIALLALVAVTVAAQPAAYDFNARISKHPAVGFAISITIDSPDGPLLSSFVVRKAPATHTFTHTENGRTYKVVLDVSADGTAVATFDVVEKDVMIASGKKTFLPMSLQPSPAAPDDGIYKRVGGTIKAPVVIERVEPIYPPDARAARISGIVIVEARINDRGTVDDVKVLKPLPFGLDQAAIDAVRQWVFRPGTLDGQPVPVIFNLTINFRLGDEAKPEK